jgi:hypothetical protein
VDRGWGLTTLNLHPKVLSDIKGGKDGLMEYNFNIKYSHYIQPYKVKLNYDCDFVLWKPLPWAVKQEYEFFYGDKEY